MAVLVKGLLCLFKVSLHGVVVSGGVACNSELRAAMRQRGEEEGVEVFIAPPRLCTDNAAMLGPAAAFALSKVTDKGFQSFDLNARSSMPLGQDERAPSVGNHR